MTNVITSCSFEESRYQGYEEDGTAPIWDAKTLYKAAKDQKCKKMKVPLDHLDLSNPRWKGPFDCQSMAYHCKRVMRADISIPIIMTPRGIIADGYHRLARSLAEGAKFIYAYRLKKMPDPDRYEKPE